MTEWEIITEDGDIVIEFAKPGNKKDAKRKWFNFPWNKKPEESKETEGKLKSCESILISAGILKSMEIRAQSIFRPGHEDVEILYALSGESSKVNTLHQFPVKDILQSSNQGEANVDVENMIAYMKAETGDIPGLIVIIHTHPGGESTPSTEDKLFFSSTAQAIKQHSPATEVFYGIHAISGGSVRAKTDYRKINENTIKWSSITHEHEVSFYTKDAKPGGVNII